MNKEALMRIRSMQAADLPAVMSIWNQCVASREVLYYPLTEAYFYKKFLTGEGRDPECLLVAEEEGRAVGMIHGVAPGSFRGGVPGEAYLTCLLVDRAFRGRGVGHALLAELKARMKSRGADRLSLSNLNPVNLDWRIPDTPGHDHNNMPGLDTGCAGYGFFLREGFQARVGNVAMYRALKDYALPPEIPAIRQRLLSEDVYTGPYNADWNCGFDRMCDRLGGAYYWRDVLRTEIQAWKEHAPNRDERMWADGVRPQGPRTLLTAVHDGQIVAFTGPVDLQKSGRGWFCGICTDPMYEKRGIATVLFHLLLQAFQEEGAQFCTLFTGFENHAQKIYLRAGMRPVRRFELTTLTL